MSVFSMQKVRCMICGTEFETDFNQIGGWGAEKQACSPACFEELQWRHALAMLGKPYKPNPSPKHCIHCRGLSYVTRSIGGQAATHACAACAKTRLKIDADKACQACSGTGVHVGEAGEEVCACAMKWKEAS